MRFVSGRTVPLGPTMCSLSGQEDKGKRWWTGEMNRVFPWNRPARTVQIVSDGQRIDVAGRFSSDLRSSNMSGPS
jgi:hypothetical protein